MLNDTFHTYTWSVYDRPATIDAITRTYDAFDRLVEQNISGTNYETVYTPSGGKLGVFNGSTMQHVFVPLPGGTTAEYTSSGLANYRHADWLGSDRMETDTTAHVIDNNAYAPFGEPYAQTGNGEISFTGQNKDTDWLQYDFLFRQYDPKQGRWISPDPAGTAAVNPADPQSWNRYAYAGNRPLNTVDPLGLDDGECDPDFGPFCCDPILGCCDPETGFCIPILPPVGGGGGGGGGEGPSPTPPSDGSYHPVSNWPNGETLGLPGGLNVHPLGSIGDLFGLLPNVGCGDFVACGSIGPSGLIGGASNISGADSPYTIYVTVLATLAKLGWNVGTCRITVKCRGIQTDNLGKRGMQHCDAQVTTSSGHVWSLSAGPQPNYMSMTALNAWAVSPPTEPFTGTTVYQGNSCTAASCMVQATQAWHLDIVKPQYHPVTGPNSNTWLKGTAAGCGVALPINTWGSIW